MESAESEVLNAACAVGRTDSQQLSASVVTCNNQLAGTMTCPLISRLGLPALAYA